KPRASSSPSPFLGRGQGEGLASSSSTQSEIREDPHPSPLPKKGEGEEQPLNDQLHHNQFADFHGHGWIFRAVFKKDREGRLVDRAGNLIDPNDPDKWTKAVHLKDVHLERGMQCVDCHFSQDAHGNGKLYGETRNAIEVTCIDCHGSYDKRAALRSSGP